MAVPVVNIFEVGDYDAQVAAAARTLRDGGIVVLPTETVYGAAGVLTQPKALERLRALRQGSDARPFTIHLARRDDARVFLDDVNQTGQRLMKKLWPGPVGLMFHVSDARRREVADLLKVPEQDVYSSDGYVTLRYPDHIVASDIIGQARDPVVLTAIGQSDPAQESAELEGQADLIVSTGPTRYSKPSTLLRVTDDGYEIVRAGIYDARIIERMLRTTILFVCSGNTCRSPMSEALARQALAQMLGVSEEQLEERGFTVVSAGSFAMPGARATPQAVEAVRTLGADLTRHRSRPLTVELIHQADVIFTMGRGHVSAVTSLVPSASEKTVLLDPNGDIEDPIGADVAHYQSLAAHLRGLVQKRLQETVQI